MQDRPTTPPRPWSRRELEDKVLFLAEQINPADNSSEARQIRAAAQSIRDHRSAGRQQ